MKSARYVVGIDCGTKTGCAVWDRKEAKFVSVETLKIHQALDRVLGFYRLFATEGVFVRVEDARLRKWFGSNTRGKEQGAGSIKRDSKIWEEFLIDHEIPHEMVAPAKGLTKWGAEAFASTTKWKEKCSEHARDAGMLCFAK